jgi:hypothetical protein
MSPRSKREYREAVHLRYKNATRTEKTAILDEFCATCGCHRKHAIRVLKGFKRFTKPKTKKRGKPAVYQKEEIRKPLKKNLAYREPAMFKTSQGHAADLAARIC